MERKKTLKNAETLTHKDHGVRKYHHGMVTGRSRNKNSSLQKIINCNFDNIKVSSVYWIITHIWQVSLLSSHYFFSYFKISLNVFKSSWISYAFIALFRHTRDGSKFYERVNFLHYGIFLSFSFNNLCMIARTFLWSHALVGVLDFV